MSYNKETGMYEGYIYKIYNDINDKLYIGQTIRTIGVRWTDHKQTAKYNSQYKLYRAINKYGVKHFNIQQMYKLEENDIRTLMSKLNQLEIDIIKKYNTVEDGYNILDGGNNRNYFIKKVYQYSLSGKLLRIWDSTFEASEYYNISESSIQLCCQGYNKTGHGYVWSYDQYISIDNIPVMAIHKSKHIEKHNCYNGELISLYNNADEIICDNDCIKKISLIYRCCEHKINSAYGFHWCYEGEFNSDNLENCRHKSYDMYDMNGCYLQMFNSGMDILNYLGIKNKGAISDIRQVCLYKSKSAYGYIWRYHGEEFEHEILHKIPYTKFNQYSKDNLFIKTFDRISDIKSELKLNDITGVYNCCKKKLNTSYGYQWFYADDAEQPDKTKIIKAS